MVFAFDAAGDGRGHAEDDQGDEAADVREDVPASSQNNGLLSHNEIKHSQIVEDTLQNYI